ncbi:UNVERIFIED_CONTAM: hypothetical protein Sradi_3568700 [Sesamum radiatum]|uniref:Uncharacterized protein n=1 Tax=Sesamum radiatum TaxID=300843 RepID=A0AAW2QFZ1_SESRA
MSVEIEEEITFGRKDLSAGAGSQDDPMVIKLDIANFFVHKVLVDNGSSVDIIFQDVLRRMRLENTNLNSVQTPLVGFGGSEVTSLGTIDLLVSLGEEPRKRTAMGTHEEKAKMREKEEDEIIDVEGLKKLKVEQIEPIEEHKVTELIPGEPSETTRVGSRMNEALEAMTIEFLKKNAYMFAWTLRTLRVSIQK